MYCASAMLLGIARRLANCSLVCALAWMTALYAHLIQQSGVIRPAYLFVIRIYYTYTSDFCAHKPARSAHMHATDRSVVAHYLSAASSTALTFSSVATPSCSLTPST